MKKTAVVAGWLNAFVVAMTLLPGAPLLPTWAAGIVVMLSFAALTLMIVLERPWQLRFAGLKGLWQTVREAIPMGAILFAAVAFYGGWIIGLFTIATGTAGNLKHENGQYTTTNKRVVKVLTEEQYNAAMAANQRAYSAIAMAVAAGTFVLVGVADRARKVTPAE